MQVAPLDGANLFTDADHCITEAIQFLFGFTFCRLDHQCSSYREGHRRRVEAKIYQPLCNVFHTDATAILDWADIQNALMRHLTIFTGV
ncbi:hypothetical protein D3C72_2367300 [compost metagenome]